MLIYRLRAKYGQRLVSRVLAGDQRAIAKLEKLAWEPRKQPALLRFIESIRNESN
jgi:hypothetical protein